MSWLWNFGDGTTSTLENPTHVFTRSGNHFVTLRVSDGQVESAYDSQSTAMVRVTGDHPITVKISAVLPDGRPVDFTAANIVGGIQLVHGLTTLPASLAITPGEISGTFAMGDWEVGDLIQMHLRDASFMPASLGYSVRISEDTLALVSKEFVLPLPLDPSIVVENGEDTLLEMGEDQTADGIPVYRDPAENLHGYGYVNFTDGFPATGGIVILEIRYVPLSLFGETLSGEGGLASGLIGWCEAGSASVMANGRYEWVLESQSVCPLGGPMVPGVYEARARGKYPGTVDAYSEPAKFIVDPTGAIVEAIEAVTS